jgi:hypothetical protein
MSTTSGPSAPEKTGNSYCLLCTVSLAVPESFVASGLWVADTFRIQARGYANASLVQDYTLLKAAETTRQQGGTHFMVISAADASITGEIVTPGTSQTTFAGNSAYTTYNPGAVSTFIKPGQDAYIRVLNVKPGQKPPPGAISADEIIQYVGPRMQRG